MLDIFFQLEKLKKERNAAILAHYYQDPDIQDPGIQDLQGLIQGFPGKQDTGLQDPGIWDPRTWDPKT